MLKRRLLRIALLALPTLVLAGGIAWWQVSSQQAASGGQSLARTISGATIGGPFQLVDDSGQPVTEQSYPGRMLLVMFGFTYCPDVCPTELAKIAQALALLGDDADAVQPLFITIDPARDTPEALADYVEAFDPRIVGLTGSDEQIAAAASAYRVYYAKVETGDGEYVMDHSTFIYLMAPDGSNLNIFPGDVSPEQMAEAIAAQLA